MKRIICYIMALAAITAVKAQNETELVNWTDYTEAIASLDETNKTMTITNERELAMLAYGLNTFGFYADYTVTLDNDLDLGNPNLYWIPIGTTDHPFTGTFNGAGYTISNLKVYVDGDETGNVAGLFGKIGEGGVVQDVNIYQVSVMFNSLTGENINCAVGSIAGYNSGTIVGCSNTALVGGDWKNASVGGIVGENGSTGVIQNCYNLGEVYVADVNATAKIGGIVGENNHTVQNCFFKAPSSQTKTNVYICGNSGGTVTGCFYVDGNSNDLNRPTVFENSLSNTITVSETAQNILIKGRTIYGDGAWNTLCLPFDIPEGASGRSPIAGAEVKQLKSSFFAKDTLTLDFEDVTSIKAGMPYIVKWADTKISKLSNPVFLNVTVSAATSGKTEMLHWVNFVGTYDPISFGAGGDNTILYLGGDNTLYYPSGTFTINAFRAYFQLKDGLIAGEPNGSAGIRSFVLNFDGERETQGIIATTVSASSADASWTTLGGQRLAAKPTRPGLYIQQGRKVIVK